MQCACLHAIADDNKVMFPLSPSPPFHIFFSSFVGLITLGFFTVSTVTVAPMIACCNMWLKPPAVSVSMPSVQVDGFKSVLIYIFVLVQLEYNMVQLVQRACSVSGMVRRVLDLEQHKCEPYSCCIFFLLTVVHIYCNCNDVMFYMSFDSSFIQD